MIVVHAFLRCKPGRRDETVAALVEMRRATLAGEPGCLHYAYTADLEDDHAFVCVEEWRDLEALRAHIASPHMAVLDGVLAETAEGPEEIRVFEAMPAELP
ncbi:putative quinol monooxygenase [Flindersiella endophytica]